MFTVCGLSCSTIHTLSSSAAGILVMLRDTVTLYEISFTYYHLEICTAFMPNGGSCGFQLEAVSQAHPWSNVAQGQFLRFAALEWYMPEIHLDRRLRRMSYTTLKHLIARTPHSSQVADVIAEFQTRNSKSETRGCGACSHANGTRLLQAIFGIRELEHRGQERRCSLTRH